MLARRAPLYEQFAPMGQGSHVSEYWNNAKDAASAGSSFAAARRLSSDAFSSIGCEKYAPLRHWHASLEDDASCPDVERSVGQTMHSALLFALGLLLQVSTPHFLHVVSPLPSWYCPVAQVVHTLG